MSRVKEFLEAVKPTQTAGEICRDFLAQKLGLADIYMMLPFVKNTLSKKYKIIKTAVSLCRPLIYTEWQCREPL